MVRSIFFTLILVPAWILGQYTSDQLGLIVFASNEEELVMESSRMMSEDHLMHAEKVVDRLLEMDPDNCNYNYRKGFILAEGRHEFKKALPYLEKAVKATDKNYDIFALNEKSAALDSWYHLGKCYHREAEYDKAIAAFNSYLDLKVGQSEELVKLSKLALKQIEVAKKMALYPKRNVKVVNLGDQINSKYPEYSAVVSFDGSALFFTSRRAWTEGQTEMEKDTRNDLYSEDIYVSYRDTNDKWMEPSRLSFCDAGFNEASLSISIDERRIYVYKDNQGNGDIFYSDFKTNRFREIQPYSNNTLNTEAWETHCFVSPDGKNVFFTSDREGGYGGRDLYRITKMPDGTWSQPANLGPKVNTEFDEESPFMSMDNKTLYFASNGPKSMGGYDIFVTILDDNNWSNSVNMGIPINSTDDDLFYTETIDGRRGYITSMRGDTYGEKDIYEVTNDYMSVTKGTLFKGRLTTLNKQQLPEDVTVSVVKKGAETKPITVFPRIRDGVFMMIIDPCSQYDLVFNKKLGGDEFYRETFKTDCNKPRDVVNRELFLDAEKMEIYKAKPVPVVEVDSNAVDSLKTIAAVPDIDTLSEQMKQLIEEEVSNTIAKVEPKVKETIPIDKKEEVKTPVTDKATLPKETVVTEVKKTEVAKVDPTVKKTETKPADTKSVDAKVGDSKATTTTKEVAKTEEPKSSGGFGEGLKSATAGMGGGMKSASVGIGKQVNKTKPSYNNLSMRHSFGYNSIKLSVEEGDLKEFLSNVEKQLEGGKAAMTIEIYSSASKVPTKTFVDNQLLTEARAKVIKEVLETYFSKSPHAAKVKIAVVGAVVAGPDFANDALNVDKYGPYQFVELKAK